MDAQAAQMRKVMYRSSFSPCPNCGDYQLYRSFGRSLLTPWDKYCWTCSWQDPPRKTKTKEVTNE